MASSISVCNLDDGGTGMNFYSDETCETVSAEAATSPSCTQTSPGAECTDSFVCALMTECVDAGKWCLCCVCVCVCVFVCMVVWVFSLL